VVRRGKSKEIEEKSNLAVNRSTPRISPRFLDGEGPEDSSWSRRTTLGKDTRSSLLSTISIKTMDWAAWSTSGRNLGHGDCGCLSWWRVETISSFTSFTNSKHPTTKCHRIQGRHSIPVEWSSESGYRAGLSQKLLACCSQGEPLG
jgi:hypothetical protein